jgi:hypothetical protein
MKRATFFLFIVGIVFFAALPLGAQVSGSTVGLGLSAGVALPQGSPETVPGANSFVSFNWGFYVNIPLIYTFHLTPSSELYKFGSQNATDFDIAFKFIVPLSEFSIYAGFVPGLTTVADVLAIHVGALAGGSFHLISNLEAFVQAKYVWLFVGNQNIGVLHLTAGILFTF